MSTNVQLYEYIQCRDDVSQRMCCRTKVLGRSVPWMMCPLDDASLGRYVLRTIRPSYDTSLIFVSQPRTAAHRRCVITAVTHWNLGFLSFTFGPPGEIQASLTKPHISLQKCPATGLPPPPTPTVRDDRKGTHRPWDAVSKRHIVQGTECPRTCVEGHFGRGRVDIAPYFLRNSQSMVPFISQPEYPWVEYKSSRRGWRGAVLL